MPDTLATLKAKLAIARERIKTLESQLDYVSTKLDVAENAAQELRLALQRLYDAVLDAPPGGDPQRIAMLHLRHELLETRLALEATGA